MVNMEDVENYSGFESIFGFEFFNKMFEYVKKFGVEYVYGDIKEVVDGKEYKVVKVGLKEYKVCVVIIVVGVEYKKIGVSGEKELGGCGVFYCVVCDGVFFKGKEFVVVGGGDFVVEEGVYLICFVLKVMIVYRCDKFCV